MSISRRFLAVVAVGLVVVGCGAPGTGPADRATTSTSSRDAGPIRWSACGSIQCGLIEVRAVPEDQSSPAATLRLFRRESPTMKNARTLVLLPDRGYGYDARQLAELAPVLLGAAVSRFDIVSVEPRGWPGSSMPGGFAHRVASLDVVDDLEVLRSALGVDSASVVAWGRGATIGATWKMTHPASVDAMVLDTPWDPSVSVRKQAIRQIDSSVSAARGAVRWCASHLSCPLNANTTSDLRTILKHVRDGRIDARVTRELLARAAVASLSQGDPRTLFVALTEADSGDASALVELAGAAPGLDDAQSACADVSVGSASAIVSAFVKMTRSKKLLFHLGIEGPLYSMCSDLPPAERPLGTVKPLALATGAKVMTIVARSDPMWPGATVSTMAARMKWLHKTVAVSRHLVVGFDRATTAAAVDFLTS